MNCLWTSSKTCRTLWHALKEDSHSEHSWRTFPNVTCPRGLVRQTPPVTFPQWTSPCAAICDRNSSTTKEIADEFDPREFFLLQFRAGESGWQVKTVKHEKQSNDSTRLEHNAALEQRPHTSVKGSPPPSFFFLIRVSIISHNTQRTKLLNRRKEKKAPLCCSSPPWSHYPCLWTTQTYFFLVVRRVVLNAPKRSQVLHQNPWSRCAQGCGMQMFLGASLFLKNWWCRVTWYATHGEVCRMNSPLQCSFSEGDISQCSPELHSIEVLLC